MAMGKKVSFDPIPGVIGQINPNMGMEIILRGPGLDAVRRYLTAYNNSVSYQLSRTEHRRTFNEEMEEKKKAEIADLKEKLVREYYGERPDGSLSVPIGFWYLCEKFEGHLNTTIPCSVLPNWLRDYQKEDIRVAMKYNRAIICEATGLGKTRIALSIAHLSQLAKKRTCIIVPTIDLVKQTLEACKELGIENTSGAGGKYHYKPGCDILVTTIDSAYKYIDCFQVIAVDECLPYETEIATEDKSVKIGSLYQLQEKSQPLPLVKTYNEKTEKFEYKQVVRVIKQKDRDTLLQLTFSKIKVKSTHEHPFLTTKGWKNAEELEIGDLCIGTYDKSAGYSMAGCVLNDDLMQVAMGIILGDGALQQIPSKKRFRLSCIHGIKQKEYAQWKAHCFGVPLRFIEKNGYAQTPAVVFTTKVIDLPFGKNKTSLSFTEFECLDERGLAIWYMDDGSLCEKQVALHTESFSYEEHLQMVSLLSKKFDITFNIRKTTKKDGRSFYYLSTKGENGLKFLKKIAPFMHSSMQYKNIFAVGRYKWNAEYKQFGTYKVTKIEEIEYKRKKGEGFGLFDLEIAGNHNFCVSSSGNKSSVVVHNCHHSAASTWFSLLASAINATNVYALSATPYRTDGMDVAIHAWCGPVVVNRTAAWGIEKGWLARPDIYTVQISDLPHVSSKKIGAIAYNKLAHHAKTQEFLLKKIQAGLAAGRTIMVIFNTVKAGQAFKKYCKGRLDFDVAHADYRKPFLEYKEGKTNLLVGNVKLFGEGVDVPRTDCIITLCNNSSEIITRQVIGRAMRISKNKKDAVILDIWFDNYEPYVKARNNRVKTYLTIVDKIKEICV